MIDGYPKYTAQGGKDKFTFRFPRFNTKVVYDPIIGTSSSIADENNNGGSMNNEGTTRSNNKNVGHRTAVSLLVLLMLFLSVFECSIHV